MKTIKNIWNTLSLNVQTSLIFIVVIITIVLFLISTQISPITVATILFGILIGLVSSIIWCVIRSALE